MVGNTPSSDARGDDRADWHERRSIPAPLRRFLLPTNRLTDEDAFEILYNPRRRYTMGFLHRHSRPCSMEELVEHIAAAENGVPIGELNDQQRRRVYVSLYQTHLPMLDEADAIEYDPQAQEIAPGPATEELTPYLDTPAEREVPWGRYYSRLFVAYAAVGGAIVVGLAPAPSLLALTILGTVLFLAVAWLHGTRRMG